MHNLVNAIHRRAQGIRGGQVRLDDFCFASHSQVSRHIAAMGHQPKRKTGTAKQVTGEE
jgi:hypothetical protein